MTNDVLYV